MNSITLYRPGKIAFGENAIEQLPEDCKRSACKKVLIISIAPLQKKVDELLNKLDELKIDAKSLTYLFGEPTIGYFEELLTSAQSYHPDCVVGMGGGSVLDVAKLIAALCGVNENVCNFFGSNLLPRRTVRLVAVPTTAGTGSEVSPNAILLNEKSQEKMAVISPFLVPDFCYIDPVLTVNLPPNITAETGLDALTHCIEAYTNKFSHPIIDHYALAGIRLIAENLETAYRDGTDLNARAGLLLGSMYGGLCLGPVNTAAVHALSYGLGGKYNITHGLANAILLPGVMRFNLKSEVEKYRQIALAIGVKDGASPEETAVKGIDRIAEIAGNCGIPHKLSDINVRKEDVEDLAVLAMNVTRLLVNNPREITKEDAINIYKSMF